MLAFATARLGAVLVPVNFMLGADEIGFILTHCGATGFIAEDALDRDRGEGDGVGRAD